MNAALICPACGHDFMPPSIVLRVGDVEIDTGQREIRIGSVRIPVSEPVCPQDERGRFLPQQGMPPMSFNIVAALARRPGVTLSDQHLMDLVGMWEAEPHTLSVHISRARAHIGHVLAILRMSKIGYSIHPLGDIDAAAPQAD